jgi:hypothetical protein
MKRSFIMFQYNTGSAYEQAGGAQPAQPVQTAGAIGAQQNANQAQGAQPTGVPPEQTSRPAQYREVYIYEVRDYPRNGKTMFSFNNGSLHLSYAQLQAAGVDNPRLLQGTTMMVDFFKIGEVLLNNQVVRDDNRIVRQFVCQFDREVEKELAVAKGLERMNKWASMVTQSTGGGTQSRTTSIMGAAPGAPLNATATGHVYTSADQPLAGSTYNQAQLGQRDFSQSAQGANTGAGAASTHNIGNPANQAGGEEQLVNEP